MLGLILRNRTMSIYRLYMDRWQKFEFITKYLPDNLQKILDHTIDRFYEQARSQRADQDIERAFTEAPERKEIQSTRKRPMAMAFLSGFVAAMFLIAFAVFFLENEREARIKKITDVTEVGTKSIPAELCNIKGNINAEGVKIYHMPGDFNYEQIAIDEVKGEHWFCEEEQAESAGFRRAIR